MASIDHHQISADAPPAAGAGDRAAYLLVESLIHALVARDIIPLETAIEIVDVAEEVAGSPDESDTLLESAGSAVTVALLGRLAASLRSDRGASQIIDP